MSSCPSFRASVLRRLKGPPGRCPYEQQRARQVCCRTPQAGHLPQDLRRTRTSGSPLSARSPSACLSGRCTPSLRASTGDNTPRIYSLQPDGSAPKTGPPPCALRGADGRPVPRSEVDLERMGRCSTWKGGGSSLPRDPPRPGLVPFGPSWLSDDRRGRLRSH